LPRDAGTTASYPAAVPPQDPLEQLLDAIDDGLMQALYRLASVRPDEVLRDLRGDGDAPAALDDLHALPVAQLDALAERYIRSARRSAGLSGITLGSGGWIGLPSGLLHLVVLIVRLGQRISLAYGFDPSTSRGEIELWKTLAQAVGADVDWEGTEAELMRRLPAVVTGTGTFSNPLLLKAIQAVVLRIAAGAGLRLSRWVPVVGGGAGLVLNYVQVGSIGNELKTSFRARHALVGFDPQQATVVEILT